MGSVTRGQEGEMPPCIIGAIAGIRVSAKEATRAEIVDLEEDSAGAGAPAVEATGSLASDFLTLGKADGGKCLFL